MAQCRYYEQIYKIFANIIHWGLTQDDIDEMPASILRGFGSVREPSKRNPKLDSDKMGKPSNLYRGLGRDLGPVTLEDGSVVQAGPLLMRDYWNTDLPPELKASFEHGHDVDPPHVWTHKNRMSGLCHSSTPCAKFLKRKGICTLLFVGVNTGRLFQKPRFN